jgi:hypothetical protein
MIKRILLSSVMLGTLALPALAQHHDGGTPSAIGIGQSQSQSSSASKAVSVSRGGAGGVGTATATGGNARGGAARASNSLTFNSPSATNNRSDTRTRISGRQDTTANAIAPALVASAVGTCLGSTSAGVGITGFGASFGSTVQDRNCDLRMFSEALLKTGQRNAATAILCRNPDVYLAFTSVGVACPVLPDGYTVAGQQAGVQPYQVYQTTTRGALVPRSEVVPVSKGQYAPVRVSNAQHDQEAAEAKAAAARIAAEYKTAKASCVANGGIVC